ncbi:DUF2306 domain-containing protein [Roseibium sp. M-1]
MRRIGTWAGGMAFWTAAFLSVLIALVSFRFLLQGVEASMEFVAHNLDGNALALYAHIGVAPIALALMPFQFMAGLRNRRPALHRWVGRVYVLAILVSGLAGLQLAFHSNAQPIAAAGFAALAVLWLVTTGAAFVFAMRRQFPRHRAWMLRSASLTFAAVTLRLYLGLSMASGVDFDVAYTIIGWACWVPNLLAVEIYLAATRRRFPSRIATKPA